MAVFKYLAIDAKGKTLSGSVDASSEREARKKIRSQKLTLIKFTSGGGKGKKESKSGKFKDKSLSLKTRSIRKGSSKGEKIGLEFLKRLNELHGSGMPVADSVKLLNSRLSDPYQKEIAGTSST